MRPGLGATYRLQLRPELTFSDATARLDRLVELGIETLYCSPVAEAVPGSAHGYDGVDPTALRAELGGAEGFAALSAACEQRGLGLCIDLVPNHLSTWTRGPWWRRLLAEGPDGEMGGVFDVAWGDPATPGGAKVALPVLDRPLPDALRDGLVRLGDRDGEAVLLAGPQDLPLAGGAVRDGEDVAEVLAAQHYRLVDWHDRADRNYRRFFDIDDLVGVRVERPEVFDRTHALVVELAAAGRISALRVDHVDGLREPAAYLRRLAAATGLPIVVEKILTGDERLRDGWPVAGTTGYEAIDDLGGALVDPGGYAALVAAGHREGDPAVAEATRAGRRLVAVQSFAGEIDRLAAALGVEREALSGALVNLPVYRTYLAPAPPAGGWGGGPRAAEVAPEDLAALHAAGSDARGARAVAALLEPAKLPVALGVQQLMGALMAKGVEDTAWYRLAGPLAFCEVGGDPGRERGGGLDRLHARAARRAADGRAGLVPGSTHDTKRSGDVRARLYALSERPERFEEGLAAFRRALAERHGAGGPAGEASLTRLLAQLALGVLPNEGGGEDLPGRVGETLVKGAREAKLASSWTEPDAAYEAALRDLAATALGDDARLVREAFGDLVDEVARLGAVLSLSGVVVRSALPGVPDCYQGDEAWRFSLVDPDNRRAVDEGRLQALAARLGGLGGLGGLGEPAPGAAAALRRTWRDGAVKLLATARCLAARRVVPDAFATTAVYLPVPARGAEAASALSFLRAGDSGGFALAVATRLPGRLVAPPGDLPCGASLGDTLLELPPRAPRRWRDALSGRDVAARDGTLALADVLGELPVALLLARGRPPGTG